MDHSRVAGTFSNSQYPPEKVFYGGLGLLVAFAVYVPLQLKIDARLGLNSIPIPGLAVVNILFALSIWKILQNPKPKPVLDSASSRLGTAIFIFGMFSVL